MSPSLGLSLLLASLILTTTALPTSSTPKGPVWVTVCSVAKNPFNSNSKVWLHSREFGSNTDPIGFGECSIMDKVQTLSNQDTDLELYLGEDVEDRPDPTTAEKIMTDMRYFDQGERNIIVVGDSGFQNGPLFFQKVNNENPRDNEFSIQLGHGSLNLKDDKVYWQYRRLSTNDRWSGWSNYECTFLNINGVVRVSRAQLSDSMPFFQFRCTNTSETSADAPRLLHAETGNITFTSSMVRKVGTLYLSDGDANGSFSAQLMWNTYTGTPDPGNAASNAHSLCFLTLLGLIGATVLTVVSS